MNLSGQQAVSREMSIPMGPGSQRFTYSVFKSSWSAHNGNCPALLAVGPYLRLLVNTRDREHLPLQMNHFDVRDLAEVAMEQAELPRVATGESFIGTASIEKATISGIAPIYAGSLAMNVVERDDKRLVSVGYGYADDIPDTREDVPPHLFTYDEWDDFVDGLREGQFREFEEFIPDAPRPEYIQTTADVAQLRMLTTV